MQTIIQLLSGALGSIGFGLLFHLNRRYLPAAAVVALPPQMHRRKLP